MANRKQGKKRAAFQMKIYSIENEKIIQMIKIENKKCQWQTIYELLNYLGKKKL